MQLAAARKVVLQPAHTPASACSVPIRNVMTIQKPIGQMAPVKANVSYRFTYDATPAGYIVNKRMSIIELQISGYNLFRHFTKPPSENSKA